MKIQRPLKQVGIFVLFAIVVSLAPGFSPANAQRGKTTVTEKSVRKYMEALAGDEMNGRGSASADELTAAKYIAQQLKILRIKPAGDIGGYLQTVQFKR